MSDHHCAGCGGNCDGKLTCANCGRPLCGTHNCQRDHRCERPRLFLMDTNDGEAAALAFKALGVAQTLERWQKQEIEARTSGHASNPQGWLATLGDCCQHHLDQWDKAASVVGVCESIVDLPLGRELLAQACRVVSLGADEVETEALLDAARAVVTALNAEERR